jgi:hypothetical protein
METTQEREYFKVLLDKNVFKSLCLDQHGSFIIQKLIRMFINEEIWFYQIIDNYDVMVHDQYGLGVVICISNPFS